MNDSSVQFDSVLMFLLHVGGEHGTEVVHSLHQHFLVGFESVFADLQNNIMIYIAGKFFDSFYEISFWFKIRCHWGKRVVETELERKTRKETQKAEIVVLGSKSKQRV